MRLVLPDAGVVEAIARRPQLPPLAGALALQLAVILTAMMKPPAPGAVMIGVIIVLRADGETATNVIHDRFVAALDLKSGTGDFTLAYIVRAVTAGEFKYPALVAQDMYEPETTGRTAPGKLTVTAR